MIALAEPWEVDRFSEAITRRLGLQFEGGKLGFLGEVLQRRLEALELSSQAYLCRLEAEAWPAELGALASELTVGETYFFRNNQQFRALAEVALPARMRAQAATKVLRILCAACASGEEAYSLAIVAREAVADPAWTVSVRAVDLNPAVLEKAARARYSPWALRETSPEARRKWFRESDREVVLDQSVVRAVDFGPGNLAADDADLWRPGAYDVVFCRNVLMYFAPEQARAAVARIARALSPGGYLFLGHAETLRGLSDDFHLHHSHEAFYYERKGAADDTPARAAPAPRAIAGLAAPEPSIPEPSSPEPFSDAWVDSIRQASERVEALTLGRGAAPALTLTAPTRRDLRPALDLVREERFTEALAQVRDLPAQSGPESGAQSGPQSRNDVDALLLEAMLLAHGGAFSAAEQVCRRLLSIDELNAGAHYALALCRESLGDGAGAAEHDRMAVYLDPAFAMPRLHLGLLARRAGDRAAARLELGQALVLLKREDAARILLFGGGFQREALIALCRSALGDCGGRP